ncbi:MAG: ABC transporter permease [Calditrichaeota bacterium]|nr:MAG: ABC transporter permease [Calditrichota bacterium]
MRLWQVFIKSIREQKRDLWVVGLSLAFAPLFVFIYWLMTGGTGTTAYHVLVINQDVPVAVDALKVTAGEDIVTRLQNLKYQNGSPLLKVHLEMDRFRAEQKLRNRNAAALIIIPADFSAKLMAFNDGEVAANAELTFVGDLTNPLYTVADVMVMTVTDTYIQDVTAAPRPVSLVEIPLGGSAARSEFENYVPGLLVLAIILMVFQAAMTPARDIESGVLRRLRLTPLTSFDYLGGISLWLGLVSIIAVVLTFVAAIALGFRSQGVLLPAVVITIITSLSIIGIGLLVACFSKSVSQAFVIANFPLGFLMFLTGAAFPMPRFHLFTVFGHEFALADLLPPTHAVIALNKIFTLGAGWKDIIFETAALILLSLLYFGIGVRLYQKTQMGIVKHLS